MVSEGYTILEVDRSVKEWLKVSQYVDNGIFHILPPLNLPLTSFRSVKARSSLISCKSSLDFDSGKIWKSSSSQLPRGESNQFGYRPEQ